MSGVSDGQAASSVTTFEEACEGAREQCPRVVRVVQDGARDYEVVHEIAEWCTSTSGARWFTRLCSGARDCGVVHDGTRVEVPTARQREVP